MKKYQINVRQQIVCDHTVTINVPEDKDIDSLLDKAQKHTGCLDDVTCKLEELGCEVIDKCEDEGNTEKIEIDDYNEVEREE